MSDTSSNLDLVKSIFDSIANDLNSVLVSQTAEYYNKLAAEVQPIFAGLVTCYFLFCAYKIFYGQKSGAELLQSITKIGAISIFAFSWGHFYPYFGEIVLVILPDFAEGVFGSGGEGARGGMLSIMGIVIQNIFDSIAQADGTAATIVAGIFGVVNFFIILITMALFFFIYIATKLFLAILLVLAPIFITTLLFERSRGYFNNWVNALIAPIVTLLLLCLGISFVTSLMLRGLQAHSLQTGGADLPATLLGGLVCGTLAMFLLMFIAVIPYISQALVNGGLSDIVNGGINHGVSFAKRTGTAGYQSVKDRVSHRRR